MQAGVYISAGIALTWREHLAAACLACGPAAVASHRAAVTVWGLADDIFVPEVTVPAGTRRSRPGIEIHESEVIEACGHNGFQVTTPMRTLLDAMSCAPPDRVLRMVDGASRRQLIHVDTFAAYLDRPEHRSRPGSRSLRRAVIVRPRGRPIGSDAETVMFEILRDANLPLPQPQFVIETRRGQRIIDFAYPEKDLAIEVDGFGKYGTRGALDDDRARQNEIELLGFHFLRFTWTQLTETPVDVAVSVGMALGLRPTRWTRR